MNRRELMKEEIDIQLFERLVSLAAMELTAEEAVYLRGQMNQQLNVIQELDQIPADDTLEISTHGVEYTQANSMSPREDALDPLKPKLNLEKFAPDVKENFIIVPEIPHQKL